MGQDVANLFKEKNKSILLNTLKYDVEKNVTSLLETIVNIFNNEFDTAIYKIVSIYEDSGEVSSKKYITDTINRMKLDSYKEVENLLNDKKIRLEKMIDELEFSELGLKMYYELVQDTTNVLKDSLKKISIEEVQREAIIKFKQNIELVIDEEKKELVLFRVQDYFVNRLYRKLETKIYMEIEIRDNNLLNKAKEGYERYQQIVAKTESRV